MKPSRTGPKAILLETPVEILAARDATAHEFSFNNEEHYIHDFLRTLDIPTPEDFSRGNAGKVRRVVTALASSGTYDHVDSARIIEELTGVQNGTRESNGSMTLDVPYPDSFIMLRALGRVADHKKIRGHKVPKPLSQQARAMIHSYRKQS